MSGSFRYVKYWTGFAVFLAGVIPSQAGQAMSAETNGVKHSLSVSIGLDPETARTDTPVVGRLTLLLRVSAHSKTADFAGEIPVQFDSVDLTKDIPFRTVWSQNVCHERRGLPRIWTLRLSGSMLQSGNAISILAEPRRLGALLPKDELKTEQNVETKNDDAQSERILRARSLVSHLLVKLKLGIAPCEL